MRGSTFLIIHKSALERRVMARIVSCPRHPTHYLFCVSITARSSSDPNEAGAGVTAGPCGVRMVFVTHATIANPMV